jgi:hypothetical protein
VRVRASGSAHRKKNQNDILFTNRIHLSEKYPSLFQKRASIKKAAELWAPPLLSSS